VSCDVTRPFEGRFVVHRLGLATVNLYTKYEVSMFTQYKGMKGDKKMQKNGGFRGLGVAQSLCHSRASCFILVMQSENELS